MPAASFPIEDRLAGILFRIGSATAFGVMGAMLKLASLKGVSAPEMIAYRNLFGLPIVLLWIWHGPGFAALSTRRPLAHLTRSGIGLVSMFLTFQALVMLPLAEATTVTFTAPIFATLLSAALLRERVGWQRWSAVATGFLGILIVARPGGTSDEVSIAGVAVALGAAVGQAAVAITVRQIARTEHIAATVFWFTVTTATAGLLSLPFFGHAHGWSTWGLLLLAGLTGGTGQICMTSSLRAAPVAVVAPFDYGQMLYAILFGWLLFGDAPGLTTLCGAALIAGSGLHTVLRETLRGRAREPAMQ